MAVENNYPNGYKDGWSSADHETQSYSPYAAERAIRENMANNAERERIMAEYQDGLDKERRYYEKIAAEQLREEWRLSQIEQEGREQVAQRRKAINIIVQEKKEEYNKKSWFGKGIATLRGKSFDKMRKQITEAAERRIDRMQPEQVENFIENHTKREGR